MNDSPDPAPTASAPLLRALFSRRALRHYRVEIIVVAAYGLFTVGLAILRQNWLDLLTPVALTVLLASSLVRAVAAHRAGFVRGVEAVAAAHHATTPARAREILAGSCELWDPPPAQVARDLALADIERHANGGS